MLIAFLFVLKALYARFRLSIIMRPLGTFTLTSSGSAVDSSGPAI
jgi:hypothetical protein